MNEPAFGKAKPLEEITLDDVVRHPIWVWALDEETVEGQDETWQKPVTNTSDLTHAVDHLWIAVITAKVVGADLYVNGEYDHGTGRIDGLSIWHEGEWKMLRNVPELQAPVEFEAVPSLYGEEGVRFVCNDLTAEEAVRADGKTGSLLGFFRKLWS